MLHGAFTAGALLIVAGAPLPALFWLLKVPLLLLMIGEGLQQQQRLAQRQGLLQCKGDGSWRWQGVSWHLARPIRWLPGAALLVLRSEKGRIRRMWLLQDMMSCSRWRQFRACLLHRTDNEH